MIALVGDIHGAYGVLQKVMRDLPEHVEAVIQVGDFGYWPQLFRHYMTTPFKSPFFFIDGNHDHVERLLAVEEPIEVWPNAIYVPRGTIIEFEQDRVLFMGGAVSVDRKYRTHKKGINAWFEEEVIRERDYRLAAHNLAQAGRKISLIVTHSPPISTNKKYFPWSGLISWLGLKEAQRWVDRSAMYVQDLWDICDRPPLVCGHMHRSVTDGNVRVLDINEVYYHG